MERLGRAASAPVRVYLVGGTSAVLMGWRDATIDIDLAIRPHDDALLRAIPEAKNALDVNIELASPADFIPLPAGWEDRSPFVAQHHQVAFHHFDFYCQALAKLEPASPGCRRRCRNAGTGTNRAGQGATVF